MVGVPRVPGRVPIWAHGYSGRGATVAWPTVGNTRIRGRPATNSCISNIIYLGFNRRELQFQALLYEPSSILRPGRLTRGSSNSSLYRVFNSSQIVKYGKSGYPDLSDVSDNCYFHAPRT